MSWLGLLNFVVLQWFGVRLARVTRTECMFNTRDLVGPMLLRLGWIELEDVPERTYTVGWTVLRWMWPLTGWWSSYRWIARRGFSARPSAREVR